MLVCKSYDQIPDTGILQIKESKMSVFVASIIRSIESDPIDFRKDWVYIQKSSLELAKKKGLEQAKTEVVINAHKANLNIKLIQQLTGLSLAEVEKIIGEYQ